jgi:hypothetical protein
MRVIGVGGRINFSEKVVKRGGWRESVELFEGTIVERGRIV